MFTKRILGLEAPNLEEKKEILEDTRVFDVYTIYFDLHEQAASTNPKARIIEAEVNIKIPKGFPRDLAIQYLDKYLVRKYGTGLLVYYEILKFNGDKIINSRLDEFITGSRSQ